MMAVGRTAFIMPRHEQPLVQQLVPAAPFIAWLAAAGKATTVLHAASLGSGADALSAARYE